MDLENEFSSINLSRSKSFDDLSMSFESEIEISYSCERKRFSRQGAIRKRILNMDNLMNKRNSLAECKIQIGSNLTSLNKVFEFNLDKERDSKKSKNSFTSLTIVKDMWRSLKRDHKVSEKESIKRKHIEGKIQEYPGEVNCTDINSFFRRTNEKFKDTIDLPMALMDASWEELVDGAKTMSKQETDLQAAVWEIIETESNLIRQLSVITNVFYPVLENILTTFADDLHGVNIETLFGNITDLYIQHCSLWNNYISLPLSISTVKRLPLDIILMKDGFCKISEILSAYISYMQSLPVMREKIRKLQSESSVFKQYIEWTKGYSRLCRDGHVCILSLPFQRITRYKILLERVKSLTTEHQNTDISEMIESVHSFLQRMNSTMVGKYSMKDIKEKIVAGERTSGYICETKRFINRDDLRFDIMRPLMGFPERILIHEGRLKLRVCNNKTLDIHCFLCNDLLLICKPIKNNCDRLKMHKSPIRLDKLLVKEESEGSVIIVVYDDFRVVENVMVMNGAADEIKLWIEKCNKARLAFINEFVEHSRDHILSDHFSFEGTTQVNGEESLQDEYHRSCRLSITNSSIDSTCSTDSGFSQTSSSSTQTDCGNSSKKTLAACNSPSLEDFSVINDIHHNSKMILMNDSV